MDHPRFHPVKTDKAQSSQDLFGTEQGSHLGLVAQAILEGHDRCLCADQRRKQSTNLVVGGGFQSDQNEVANAYLCRGAGAFRLNVKIAFYASNLHAVAPYGLVIGAQQQMDFPSGATQFRAVVTAQRAAAHHADFHGTMSSTSEEGRRADQCRPSLLLPHSGSRKQKGHPEISGRPGKSKSLTWR